MKKTLVFLPLAFSLAFCASNTQIKKFYEDALKERLEGVKVEILKREKLPDTDFEAVTVKFSAKGMSQEDLIFTKDNIIAPDIIDVKQNISYKQSYELKKMEKERENFSKKALKELEKEKMIISLGDKTKPLLYVFSDPECPYCRMHLKNIRQELKTHQMKLILTPVHGISAFDKAALIYKESKNAKSDEEKIKILEKYYDEKIAHYSQRGANSLKVDEKEVDAVQKLYQKYSSLGLRAVPMIVEAK